MKSGVVVALVVGAALGAMPTPPARATDPLEAHVRSLQFLGAWPVPFAVGQLDQADLLIFDDALHPAVEPFRFYRDLLARDDVQDSMHFIFVEAFPVNYQRDLDAYFATEPEDVSLLAPLFQNDYSGVGWVLETYLDLVRFIYARNQGRAAAERYRVVAVSNPVYWEALHDAVDLEAFRKALVGRDYFMYRVILDEMGNFEVGRKGVFLTNTRHAYKGIRQADGTFYWNTGTFFAQWHPGRTYSIHIHNVQLFIERERQLDPEEPETTAGMERRVYRMGRVANGLWDSAFASNGNRPVAVPLEGTPFGDAPYAGNHMLDVAPGQTMRDAFDAVIFLAPLEELHFSATFDFIYTDAFRSELVRRYHILYTDAQLDEKMAKAGVSTLEELIAADTVARPERPLPYLDALESIDAWKAKEAE